ncbi:MAG: alpha/beta fold hydrolase [Planctomycetota bacterium]
MHHPTDQAQNEPAPASPNPPSQIGRLVLVASTTLLVLAAVGVVGCSTNMIESVLFYYPSPRAVQAPDGAEDVTFPSSVGRHARGKTLHAWWLAPTTDRPKGTVLFCHGNADAIDAHHAFVSSLPSQGYGVLLFDYRGYGRSEWDGRLNRDRLIADAVGALDYLRARNDVDPGRLFLIGHSMGSMVASNLAADTAPGTFRALTIVSPFSSFPRVAGDYVPVLGPILIPGGRAPEDAVTKLGDLPLLIVFGNDDAIVRPYHAPIIHEAATNAGVATELREVPGANHITVLTSPSMQAEIAAFFDAHLPADTE